MKAGNNQCTAGLVFLSARQNNITDYSAAAVRALEHANLRITSVDVASQTYVSIATPSHIVDIQLPEAVPPASHIDRIRRTNQISLGGMVSANGNQSGSDTEATIKISVYDAESRNDDIDENIHNEALMARVTCHLVQQFYPNYVMWKTPDAIVEAEDFVRAASKVSPRRVTSTKQGVMEHQIPRPVLNSLEHETPSQPSEIPSAHVLASNDFSKRFPNVDEATGPIGTELDRRMHSHQSNASYSDFAALDLTAVFGRDASRNKNPNILSVHEPSDAIARLAAWMIALTVGVISLPLGVFVIICNLFRGEDFRLSAHSLALAGVVSVLNTSGAMAHALGRVFS